MTVNQKKLKLHEENVFFFLYVKKKPHEDSNNPVRTWLQITNCETFN